jgi:hypothetical protein
MGDITDMIHETDEVDPLYDLGGMKSCRHCKTSNLHWVLDEGTGKHRLAGENGKIHTCKEYAKGS